MLFYYHQYYHFGEHQLGLSDRKASRHHSVLYQHIRSENYSQKGGSGRSKTWINPVWYEDPRFAFALCMLVEYLKNIPLFNHLKESQLREIAARCKNAQYKKGDVVFHKTDLSTDLYIVNSGKLKAVLSDDEGDEIVLAQFGQGAFFGELSLLDEKGRSATIVADKDSELAVLKQNVFLDLLFKNPRIAVELMTTLVERLRKADEMIESLAFLEVGERLVRALLDAASAEDAGPETASFLRTRKLTHKELAGRIGSSREAVSKCLKVLSVKNIVKEAEGCILIARNALERIKTS